MSNYSRRGSGKFRSSRYNDDHDDRTVRFGPQKNRGGFKSRPPKKSGYYTKRNDFSGPRSRLDDEDTDMGGDGASSSSNRRFSPYEGSRGGRVNSRGNSRGRGNRRYVNKDAIIQQLGGITRDLEKSDWYKVLIPQGKKTEKMTLLKMIAEKLTNVLFIPFNFTTEGLNAVFYVTDRDTATQIRSMSKKITLPSGFKMMTIVRASEAPTYPPSFTKDVLEKIKVVMSNRYDPPTKLLNLSNLSADPALKQEGLFLTLHKYAVMKEVQLIIKEHIPELESLDLSDNGLYTVDSLQRMNQDTPNLKKMSLAKNALRHMNDLDALRKLDLEEIILDGNPLCDRYKDETTYVSALRKKFPKLMSLDGHPLAAPIKVELETGKMPPMLDSQFGSEAVKPLICRFCHEYFTLYDSDDRKPLLNAYHESAVFSLSFCFNNSFDSRQHNFNDYMESSRNLMKIAKSRAHERLKKGNKEVIDAIANLPATQHDPDSFKVDVSHESNTLLTFTVSGLFKERKHAKEAVRQFSRTFVAAPQGQGMVIVNDLYQLTNASPAQIKAGFKTTLPPPSVASSVLPGPSTPGATAAVSPGVGAGSPGAQQVQEQMVIAFAQQSGMNLHWSKICLEQTNWDYDKAAVAFTEAKTQGKIPAEAFIK